MPQIDIARPRFCGAKFRSSSACDIVTIGPATAPCATRNAISTSRLFAQPHKNEAAPNASAQRMNTRTSPKRCASQPASSTVMAFATP